jgi:uncharacterized protein (TIGR03032 family)
VNAARFERLEHHEVVASPGLVGWLAEEQLALVFTNAARLFLVGVRLGGGLSVVERGFPTCAALAAVDAETFFMATRYQIWRMENALPPGELTDDGSDRLYVPQTAWTTGLLGVDDLVTDHHGRLLFANRRFSCVATVSETLNFEPVWKPPFITELRPDERCGLTGLAIRAGEPAYVTSASRSDSAGGWRDEQRTGGVVLSVPTGDVVVSGLSMPHSPVFHGDRLLLCNGGTGELGLVDVERGGFEPILALPGFTRGLAVHGRFAVVGTSRRKWDETFGDVALEERLTSSGTAARCGVHIVDLDTGRADHWLFIEGVGPDVGDVAVLPRVRQADAVAYQGESIENLVTFPL